MKYFLEIAYKGTDYHGWQEQDNAVTVQGKLIKALHTVFAKDKDTIKTMGSGRTDTGVHASQQFMQVEGIRTIERKHMYKLNGLLPYDIGVKRIFKVKDSAHARFDATKRSYEYHITRFKDPFNYKQAYFFPRELDVKKMNEAAALMLEWKDFQCFSKIHTDVNTFLCDVSRAEWIDHNDQLIFYVSANRFLRGMVRAITGTLLEVGQGKMSVEEFQKILESRDRNQAGRSVPPQGLFLCQVEYPEEIFEHEVL